MMRSLISLGVFIGAALASAQAERASCKRDNCLRALISRSTDAAPFCSTYTAATASATLPAWATACSRLPSRVSSACSCINTAVPTSFSSSSAIPTPSITTTSSSSSSSSSTTRVSETTTAPIWVRTAAPSGYIIVDQSKPYAYGSYPSVQAAINALSSTTTNPQSIFIFPGIYTEQVYIPPLRSTLLIQGYTPDARSYESNAATITFNLSRLNVTNNDLTATLRVWNANTKIYNLNIKNTFGRANTNGQNLAVSAQASGQGYYGCQLWGYQDTLYANTGLQLYAQSLIVGAIDFIFGQTAAAWFEQVDIRTIAEGWVTANGRNDTNNPSFYVINNSTVDGINDTIAAGSSSLGRPWRVFSRVVYQNTYLGNVIRPEGWSVWSTTPGSEGTSNVTYAEYKNFGPRSFEETGVRAPFSSQLDAPVAIETVLGSGYRGLWWVDAGYL